MPKITDIFAEEFIDTRGLPSIQVGLSLADGTKVTSKSLSTIESSPYQAGQLYDADPFRYRGLGVTKAVSHITDILRPIILDTAVESQTQLDELLIKADGTDDKSNLGANALFAVSQAYCTAEALSSQTPLYRHIQVLLYGKKPKPTLLLPQVAVPLVSGGQDGEGNNLSFQTIYGLPTGGKSLTCQLQQTAQVGRNLTFLLDQRGYVFSLGKLGAPAPDLLGNRQAFDLLTEAVIRSGYKVGVDIFFGLASAAKNFYQKGKYQLTDFPNTLTDESLLTYYHKLAENFPLVFIEDPYSVDEWYSWSNMIRRVGSLLIAGNEAIGTNLSRLRLAIHKEAISAVTVQPVQVGTITESLAFVSAARLAGYKLLVTDTAGSEDTFNTDFAVGIGADYLTICPPTQNALLTNHNRLVQIDKELSIPQLDVLS